MNYRAFLSISVIPGGEVSNFLLEDYVAVLKFMNTDTKKPQMYVPNIKPLKKQQV